MKNNMCILMSALVLAAMILAACQPAAVPTEAPAVEAPAATEAPAAELPPPGELTGTAMQSPSPSLEVQAFLATGGQAVMSELVDPQDASIRLNCDFESSALECMEPGIAGYIAVDENLSVMTPSHITITSLDWPKDWPKIANPTVMAYNPADPSDEAKTIECVRAPERDKPGKDREPGLVAFKCPVQTW